MDPESWEWLVFFQLLGPELHFFTDTRGRSRRASPWYHRQCQWEPGKGKTGLGSNGDSGQDRTEPRVYMCDSSSLWGCFLRKMEL